VDLVVLTPEAATLIHRVTSTVSMRDKEPRRVTALASSTYVHRGGKRLNVLYQETPTKSTSNQGPTGDSPRPSSRSDR
jgi:hypothetical protein